jgi:hypothetical protein
MAQWAAKAVSEGSQVAMLELFATVLGVGVAVYLLIRFPAFRVLLVVLAFLASAVVWWIIDHQQARRALAHQLIPLEQIELHDLSVASAGEGLHRLSGTATNNSDRYVLTELIIEVSVADCPSPATSDDDCEIAGTGLARAHSPWRIPPRQSRELDVDFKLRDAKAAAGTARWLYSVAETRASLDQLQ